MDNIKYKIVGVRYPRHNDVAAKRKVSPYIREIVNKNDIKTEIENMLFHTFEVYRMDYVLVRWKDDVYMCKAVDISKRTFVKSIVKEHPYADLT